MMNELRLFSERKYNLKETYWVELGFAPFMQFWCVVFFGLDWMKMNLKL